MKRLALLASFALLLPPLTAGGGEPGSAYCFGVGCPCGNDDPLGGCVNSSGAGGRLSVSGSNSLSADDAVFTATHLSATSVCILIAGSQQVSIPFSNGIRCVGGFLQRMDQHLNSGQGGTVVFQDVAARMAASGLQIQPGDTWSYQVWFRDVPAQQTPCGGSANLTNGYTITYAP